MAGLLLGCVALHGGLGLGAAPLPSAQSKKGPQQHDQQHPLGRAVASLAVAAACDTLGPAELLPCASAAAPCTAAVSNPPRTHRGARITIPTYCLSGTRSRTRRRSRLGGDPGEFDGGDGGSGGWGGDDGSGPWWWNDDGGEEEGNSPAARLQDLLLLWSVFCALAFCQTVYHVSPKPRQPPAFAALSYTSLKAQLLRGSSPQPAALAAAS